MLLEVMKLLKIILVFVLWSSCSHEEDSFTLSTSIENEVLSYMISFHEEAQLRGVDINLADAQISVRLIDIGGETVGRCLTFSNNTKTIELDRNYWDAQEDLGKEFVIYHELGHCLLDRGHLDAANQSGICVSIMHSSNDLCRNNYNTRTREAYLDELFL